MIGSAAAAAVAPKYAPAILALGAVATIGGALALYRLRRQGALSIGLVTVSASPPYVALRSAQ